MSVNDRKPIEHLGRWHHTFPGLELTPQEFYAELQRRIESNSFPGISVGQVAFRESHVLSAKRLYLRVARGELVFDICGAPFGKRLFFVSSWLGSLGMTGCGTAALGCLAIIPGLGLLAEHSVRPMTCYEIDTAHVFQDSIQSILMEYLDELCGVGGLEPLPSDRRAMALGNLFKER